MRIYKICKSLLICFVLLLTLAAVNAQPKLPDKQPAGLWVPADKVKIDGKADEWDNKYRAYNHATDLFYTLANNDNFIYLIIHAEDPGVIETITTYGFTFGIQMQGKKNSGKDIITIQFPLDEIKRLGLTMNKIGVDRDTSVNIENAIMNSNNSILQQRHKTIIINGIAGLDTLSVYNDTGLKIAEAFDNKRYYTLEMAIPSRYLMLLKSGVSKFSYHILINGREGSKIGNMPINIPARGFSPEEQQEVDALYARLNKRYARTDFWGEYTLAKKP